MLIVYSIVFVVVVYASVVFTCSLSNAKRSFYRAFSCIFGKVGCVAYENIVIELSKAKCLPSLCHGLDPCPVYISQIN